jgi:guanyl-specific ribonuclease Sa
MLPPRPAHPTLSAVEVGIQGRNENAVIGDQLMATVPLLLGPVGEEIAGGAIPLITPGSLPPEEEAAVLQTLKYIDKGTTPTGNLERRWGIPFENREGHLPGQPGALPTPYTEYRVTPAPGESGAGARRIVVDHATGAVYYTPSHYVPRGGSPPFFRIR